LWLLLAAGLAPADEIELNPGHPERYTVAPGDTLWDIAGRFLAKPWQWPEIWHDNPRIADPHWIYPGDELVLAVVDGKPYLQVGRRAAEPGYAEPGPAGQRPDEVRLSPIVRVAPLGQAIPSIPMSSIQPFLTEPKVVDAGTLEQAPYVVAMADEHVVGGAGDRIYVRGLADRNALGLGYMLFRPGKPYTDTESGESLGYEALYVANADVKAVGDPSTLTISKSARDVNLGDRVQPIEAGKLQMRFQPRPPGRPVQGHIISVVDGVSQIGQWSVVVIDRGAADGLEVGHVLKVLQDGRIERDIVSPFANEEIALPAEQEGQLMVFRAYDRVSFALVMNATRAIHLHDAVTNP
jgi:hypothetical protein